MEAQITEVGAKDTIRLLREIISDLATRRLGEVPEDDGDTDILIDVFASIVMAVEGAWKKGEVTEAAESEVRTSLRELNALHNRTTKLSYIVLHDLLRDMVEQARKPRPETEPSRGNVTQMQFRELTLWRDKHCGRPA